MIFDFTINVGTVLHLFVLLGGVFALAIRMNRRLDTIELKLGLLWSEFKLEHDLNDRKS